MSRPNNYDIMAQQARKRFLTYDQSAILAKSPATADENYIYLPVLDLTFRVCRHTGETDCAVGTCWTPARSHDMLTVFDYLCDAQPDRSLSGELKSMASFGHMFHTGLLEDSAATALETAIDQNPDAFVRACKALGGTPFPNCDLGFTLPFFPDLPVTLQFWHSDEEFPPRLRYLWDSSATCFLRYETMYYALDLLRTRLETLMTRW